MIALVAFACALMVWSDVVGTFLVNAEAKGLVWLSGLMDAIGDAPKYYAAGVSGAVTVQRGFGSETILVAFVMVTSFFATSAAEFFARKMKSAAAPDQL